MENFSLSLPKLLFWKTLLQFHRKSAHKFWVDLNFKFFKAIQSLNRGEPGEYHFNCSSLQTFPGSATARSLKEVCVHIVVYSRSLHLDKQRGGGQGTTWSVSIAFLSEILH